MYVEAKMIHPPVIDVIPAGRGERGGGGGGGEVDVVEARGGRKDSSIHPGKLLGELQKRMIQDLICSHAFCWIFPGK